MGKHLDFSASEVLILEAAQHVIHAGWLKLLEELSGPLHGNAHPRVLSQHVYVDDDIGVVSYGSVPGPDDFGPEDWATTRESVLSGHDSDGRHYGLFRQAVVHAIVSADHRGRPVSFSFTVLVRGVPDTSDYKGHWDDWQAEGSITEMGSGQTLKFGASDHCLQERMCISLKGMSVDYLGIGRAHCNNLWWVQ